MRSAAAPQGASLLASSLDVDGIERAAEGGGARRLDVDAFLAAALALLLDPPVRVVADAAGLADDEVGGGERRVDALQVVLDAAVVVQEAAAALQDDFLVAVDEAGAAADAEHTLAVQRHRWRVGVGRGATARALRGDRRGARCG